MPINFLSSVCSLFTEMKTKKNTHLFHATTEKPVVKGHSKEDHKLKTDNRLIQVESIAECSLEHYAILSTCTKLPPVLKICVLSLFELPL